MIADSLRLRPRGHLLRHLVLFARLLRSSGVPVTPSQVVALVDALPLLDLRRREEFKDAARAMLVTSREQAELFDRAFDLYWQAWTTEDQPPAEKEMPAPSGPPQGEGAEPEREMEEESASAASENSEGEPELKPQPAYSAVEVLRHKDFAELSDDETASLTRLMQSAQWHPELLRSRRKRPAAGGAHPDLRRALRQGLRYGGEVMTFAWQEPKLKRRPLIVLCDISGSMERYSRFLLRFLYLLSNGLDRVEAFAFGTRLTRLTRHLRQANMDAALRQAAAEVNDWGGGTRIGESLKAFNYTWSRRVTSHGPTVLIISDGWDRGDLDLLRREISRLQLNCRRLIWLNPLSGAPGYEPLAQGIQTVLPYVDDFLPVHNLASLEQLAEILEKATRRRVGRRRWGAKLRQQPPSRV